MAGGWRYINSFESTGGVGLDGTMRLYKKFKLQRNSASISAMHRDKNELRSRMVTFPKIKPKYRADLRSHGPTLAGVLSTWLCFL